MQISLPLAARLNRPLIMTMLVLAYTLNFVDRQIVGILAEPIKADLGAAYTLEETFAGIAGRILVAGVLGGRDPAAPERAVVCARGDAPALAARRRPGVGALGRLVRP